ncbi:prephenate dehydratase [Sporomusaceae bacterium BoRhaA]|uniref:prephenate dehydratase n=1 Tax=Pelorhabdus rhamnosifermentans TaxID=2772457 RepID=UPI001C0645D9|nr:prephenate dehydratase [Pelorhabdus rhamnosifermentans]MBU2702177.1 prephenate dehydratase [Pelorhabdus rhamnosifermentans]
MALIGYLGPAGTYSEEAAHHLCDGDEQQFKPFVTIDAAIWAVAKGEVDTSIVPIENSLGGSVTVTLDILAHEVDLYITAEFVAAIRHNLLVKQDQESEAIEMILSHPQALAQCRHVLQTLYPGVSFKPVDSTAEAARLVAEGTGRMAAISSAKAAKQYGLSIVNHDVQDNLTNCTRFVRLERVPQKTCSAGPCKTSIVCEINGKKPGSLCEILQEFSIRNVNLTRIESRPARTGLGRYIFFLDMEGRLNDAVIAEAVAAVQKKSFWFKNLGTYAVGSY